MGQQPTAPLLELTGLTAGYRIRSGALGRRTDVHAVSGVDLTVDAGETVGLVGESGCGKSTLARTIVRLLRPSSGTVRFDGHDLAPLRGRSLREVRRHVQMVFQDPSASLNPRMTAAELIKEAWRIHPGTVPRQGWDADVGELLERVGLSARQADRYPREFSGGQRQRLCIARALAVRPRLIVCDEAVSALDVSIQAQILALLKTLQRDLGVAYLFISHDLGVVRQVAHRVAVMHLGTIVEEGATEQVYEHASHPYTQALLSAAPSVQDWRRGSDSEIVLAGEAPSPLAPPAGCRFRTRCWKAQELCRDQEPALVPRGAGHPVACHFASADIAAEAGTP